MSGGFVWPPGREELAPQEDGPATIAVSSRRSLWGEVERVWLGERRPATEVRLVEAGWAPDEAEAYCPRCATSVGAFEADVDGCAACRGRRLVWEGAVRLGAHTGVLRDLVHELKFERDRHAGRVLGGMLGERIAWRLRRAGVDPGSAVVVPVATTFRRRAARGIDHALTLARAASEAGGMGLASGLVRRHRPSQRSVALSVRRRQVSGTMRRRAGFDVRGRVVVVVDDVRTTGATMTEACRALNRGVAGGVRCRVWSAIVAVTSSEGRR